MKQAIAIVLALLGMSCTQEDPLMVTPDTVDTVETTQPSVTPQPVEQIDFYGTWEVVKETSGSYVNEESTVYPTCGSKYIVTDTSIHLQPICGGDTIKLSDQWIDNNGWVKEQYLTTKEGSVDTIRGYLDTQFIGDTLVLKHETEITLSIQYLLKQQ